MIWLPPPIQVQDKTKWFIKLGSDPGFLFSKNWIPDFNHYLDSITRRRSGGNYKGDLASWSRKKTTGPTSLLLSISAVFRIPKPWILGSTSNNFPDSGIHSSVHGRWLPLPLSLPRSLFFLDVTQRFFWGSVCVTSKKRLRGRQTATGHSWFAFHKKYWFFGAPNDFFFFKMACLHKIVASDQ